jgi:hypothetical protein
VLESVLKYCSPETVVLFVQHVADPLTEKHLWGSNPISLTFDVRNNVHVAEYLYSIGVRDEEPSLDCLRWMKGTGKLHEGDPGWSIAGEESSSKI